MKWKLKRQPNTIPHSTHIHIQMWFWPLYRTMNYGTYTLGFLFSHILYPESGAVFVLMLLLLLMTSTLPSLSLFEHASYNLTSFSPLFSVSYNFGALNSNVIPATLHSTRTIYFYTFLIIDICCYFFSFFKCELSCVVVSVPFLYEPRIVKCRVTFNQVIRLFNVLCACYLIFPP